MEASPPPITNAATNPTTAAATYPDSVDSSPRSSWDSAAAGEQKLRVMCSFGGHILPRPHDKSLCYLGGETRIIAIDRHNASLSDLHDRLSKTLLSDHPKPFSIKYQLPTDDLDSLISLATDEDLDNMVDEYDRLAADNLGRLRLFVFAKTTTPSSSSLPLLSSGNSSCNLEQMFLETVASTKSEEWFLNALNGKPARPRILGGGAASDRGFSETSSVNCLLGLDDDDSFVPKTAANAKDVAAAAVVESNSQLEGGLGSKSGGNPSGTGSAKVVGNNNNSNNNLQDVHSIPDSPILLDTTSSFGSTSSSPSVMAAANLAPIRVHVVAEENQNQQKVLGIEEQFQQMSVVGNANLQQKQQQEEEVGGFVPVVSGVVGGEYPNRVFSDDEKSDHSGYWKVQQIHPQVLHQFQQPYQQQQQQIPPQLKQAAAGGAFDLQSPDSISSDGSITNPLSRHRQAVYQEPIMQMQSGNNTRVVAVSQPDPKILDQNNPKVHMQPQVQESGYVLQGQYDQNHPQLHHPQQFIHSGTQYIPAGAVPMGSYYHIYPSQPQHHQHQSVLDQQCPVYYIPARQTQPYNMPFKPTVPSSHPQTSPAAVGPHSAFNQTINAPSSKPEMATGVYRQGPQLVQVTSSQHQPQYVGYTQIHHPSQSMAPPSAAKSGYAYEFSDPAHAQIYYTQSLPPHLAAQYQTLSSAPAMDVSVQVPVENVKQQVRTLQQ